jgi:transketolase
VLAAFVSGCGGGSDDSSSLTKAEYTKQADEICAKRKKEWKSDLASYEKEVVEKKATSDPEVQKELAESLLQESMLPALQEQLKALEELSAPEEIEKQAEKMLKSLSSGVGGVEKEGVESLTSSGFAKFEKESKALGVTCPL